MKDWSTKTAKDVMRTPLIELDADTTLIDAARVLTEHQITGTPVMDHQGQAIGVVSLFDIVTHLAGLKRPAAALGGFYSYTYPQFQEGGEGWEDGWMEKSVEEGEEEETRVRDIMTDKIITVPEGTPLPEVARTMNRRKIHRVFVADHSGTPVGVISGMDLLGLLSDAPPRAPRRRTAKTPSKSR